MPTRMVTVGVIALVALVFLAGCSAVSDGSGQSGDQLQVDTVSFDHGTQKAVIDGGLIDEGSSDYERAFIVTNRSQQDALDFDLIATQTNQSVVDGLRAINFSTTSSVVLQVRSSNQCEYQVDSVATTGDTANVTVDRDCAEGPSQAVVRYETLIIQVSPHSTEPPTDATVIINAGDQTVVSARTPTLQDESQ